MDFEVRSIQASNHEADAYWTVAIALDVRAGSSVEAVALAVDLLELGVEM